MIRSIIKIVLWGIVGLIVAMYVLLGKIPIEAEWMIVVLLGVVVMLGLLVVVGIGLAFCYYDAWRRWPAWAVLLGLFSASVIASASSNSSIASFGAIGLVTSGAALIAACGIWLYWHDIGLPLIVALSIGFFVSLIVWFSMQPSDVLLNYIDSLIATLSSPNTTSQGSIMFTLSLFLLCLIPLAIISVVWHTLRLIWREYHQTHPPIQ